MDEGGAATSDPPVEPGDDDVLPADAGPARAASDEGPAVVRAGPSPALEAVAGPVEGPGDDRDLASRAPGAATAGPAGLDMVRMVEALEGLTARVDRRLDAIQTLIERDLRAESSRERIVDRLHAELQEYKQDLLLQARRPIFIDLIQLHDDLGKMIEARERERERERERGRGPLQDAERGLAAEDAPSEPDDAPIEGRANSARALLGPIQTAIEDVLYRQGVETFSEEGAAFNPKRQRAVATVATDDPQLNKTIAARVRPGFQAGEKIVRPELVTVHAHRPAGPSARGGSEAP